MPFHNQDIRFHLRRRTGGILNISRDPPSDLWQWHYTQCVLRILRATSEVPRSHGGHERPTTAIRTDGTPKNNQQTTIHTNQTPKNNQQTAPGVSSVSSHHDTRGSRWRDKETRNVSGRLWTT